MPSILDLVHEYHALEKRKSDTGGVLDQASEIRLQCLKFFLEFDLAPPYAFEQAGHGVGAHQAADTLGAQYLGAPMDEGQAPGAEITGVGSSPFPVEPAQAGEPAEVAAPAVEEIPTAQDLDQEFASDQIPVEPLPAPAPEQVAPSPLDIHDDDLSQTVDSFFEAHVDQPPAEGEVLNVPPPEIVTLDAATAGTSFPGPVTEATAAAPEPEEIAVDDIEALPLEDAMPLDAPPADQAAAPILSPEPLLPVAAPLQAVAAGSAEPVPVDDAGWASVLDDVIHPDQAPAADPLPTLPGENPASEPVPVPAAPVTLNWDTGFAAQQPQAAEAPAAFHAGPSFDLPLTFDVPAAPEPTPAPAPLPDPIPAPFPAPAVVAGVAPTVPVVPAASAPSMPEPVEVPPVTVAPEVPFAPEPQPPAEPAPAACVSFAICEPHRVTVHFLDGDVKRGIIRELGYDATDVHLFSMDESNSDSYPAAALKAVFIILQPGARPPDAAGGVDVSVTFKDGRTLKGKSPDYTPGHAVFTLYPEPRQGNVERVIIFREATDEIH